MVTKIHFPRYIAFLVTHLVGHDNLVSKHIFFFDLMQVIDFRQTFKPFLCFILLLYLTNATCILIPLVLIQTFWCHFVIDLFKCQSFSINKLFLLFEFLFIPNLCVIWHFYQFVSLLIINKFYFFVLALPPGQT